MESIGTDGVVKVRRCAHCSAYLGNLGPWARLSCAFEHQHRVGLAPQKRSDEECSAIAGILSELLGVRSVVLLILGYDHGGGATVRRDLERRAALRFLGGIVEGSLARMVAKGATSGAAVIATVDM